MKKKAHILIASVVFAIILWGSISLSDDYYANFIANLELYNFPSGYTSGTQLPETVTIKLKGQGWKLFTANIGTDAVYKISVNSDSGNKFVSLYNNLSNNQWIHSDLEVIDIEPDTLSFFVEKSITKKILVNPEISFNFKPGFGLATTVEQDPDSIIVTGPSSKIKYLNEIKTENKQLASLDKKIVETLSLPKLPGTEFSQNSVKVILDVQRIVDKQFSNIEVEVIDLPPDRDVVLLPNKIDCSVRGGIDVLGKLTESDCRAYVYYSDIVLDTLGSVLPNIELPKNTNLLFTKPERLRYIVKTF